ncbi:MAG: ADP-glyceromanno-heptose 6-epimerase [Zetaproteobacteria bacterium]|nr:ADP-glyceromanno-heptose 6-epimerase [Pseudobdellovibrionaceae bacterium]
MIIVTGGAGFIGSCLVNQLNKAGYKDIHVVDEFLDEEKWKNLANNTFDTFTHKNKFLSWLKNDSAANKISHIFHMGACSTTTEKNVDFLMENNFSYSKELFSFCIKRNIPFIYASSAATYGLGEKGYSDNEEVIENLKPLNPYGFSKHLFDKWLLKQEKKPPLWQGFKFFNVYGPNEYHKGSMQSVVAHAVPQILATGKLKLFKSYKDNINHGEQKRDFIYVKDVVNVMLEQVTSYEKAPELSKSGIYNLGTGQARSFVDLGKAVFAALNKTPCFEWVDMPEGLREQYQYFTEADMSKFRKELSATHQFYTLEDGIYEYVKNFLNKEDPYL